MSCCESDVNALLLSPSKITLIAAVAMVDDDGRVLIARRPEGKPMAGLWEFPGGKLEEGETPEAALVREMKEELGVETCAGCMSALTVASHRYEMFHLLMPLFVCRQWKGIPQALEGQELKWVQPSELSQYPMPEANRTMVSLVKQLL